MASSIPMVSGGDIRQCRFVKLSTAADRTLLEADANERIYGISAEGAQDAPIPNASVNAAEATDYFPHYGPGEECLLELGSGGATRGGQLKSDADGKGVAAAATGTTQQFVGAEALESGSEGEKIFVRVWPAQFYPALA